MTVSYKPDGYPDLSPYLAVPNAAGFIEFVVNVLDGEELFRFENEDGTINHAEVRVGDGLIMLSDSSPDWPATPAHLHLYLPDVDATYRRALDAGATSVQEPVQKRDADKRGGIRDASGVTWWISTQVEERA